jgi:hypothetical protein
MAEFITVNIYFKGARKMKSKKLQQIVTAAAIIVGTGFAMQANAFTYKQAGGFVGGTATPTPGVEFVNPIIDTDAPANTYSMIQWDEDEIVKSDLRIQTFSDTINPDGSWVTISRLFHDNNEILGRSRSLETVDIGTNLRIYEGATTIMLDPGLISLTFKETENRPAPRPCNDGNPLGSQCDDLFSFALNDFAPVIFYDLSGTKYAAYFNLGNFVNAATDFPYCDTNPEGCTVWTAEFTTSSLDVLMSIQEVPEPASLALIGIGLLGFGIASKRKARS